MWDVGLNGPIQRSIAGNLGLLDCAEDWPFGAFQQKLPQMPCKVQDAEYMDLGIRPSTVSPHAFNLNRKVPNPNQENAKKYAPAPYIQIERSAEIRCCYISASLDNFENAEELKVENR